MLRLVLYIVGVALLLLALMTVRNGELVVFLPYFLIGGVALVAGLAFERWRYKPLRHEHPDPRWIDTGERFIDPESNRLTGVWFDPVQGERHYLVVENPGRRRERGFKA